MGLEPGASPGRPALASFTAKLQPLVVCSSGDDDGQTGGDRLQPKTAKSAGPPQQQAQQTPATQKSSTAVLKGAQGAVKLPLIKPTRYGLGAHAIRVLRAVHDEGVFTEEGAAQAAASGSNFMPSPQPSSRPAASSITLSPGAMHAAAPPASATSMLSPFTAGWPSRTPSPPIFTAKARAAAGSIAVVIPSRASVTSAEVAGATSPGAAQLAALVTARTPSVGPQQTEDGAARPEASGAGEAAGAAEEDGAPRLYMDDDDELTGRLLSLPNILCHAANGDVFLVGLGEVQNMLHKRRLGSQGLAVLRRFENATMAAWDVGREKAEDTYSLKWRQKHEAKLAAAARKKRRACLEDEEGGGSGTGGVPGSPSRVTISRVAAAVAAAATTAEDSELSLALGGLSAELEAEVQAHLAASMQLVEKHRAHLICNSDRALAEVAKQQAVEAATRRKAQAVDFVVKQLIPEKILAMANTRRTKLAEKSQLFRRMKHSLAGSAHKAAASTATAASEGEEEDAGSSSNKGAGRWGKLKVFTEDALANMPFIDNWNAAIKKLGKNEPGSGWDELLVQNNIYVKGTSGDGQGAAVYTYHCQQLGVIPSTQVVTQLKCSESNMSHCKLGRRGAQALRHALAANTTITSLDLTDNSLDAQGVAEISAGLSAGSMAKMAPKARKVLQDKWKALDWVKAVKHAKADNVLAAPNLDAGPELASSEPQEEGEARERSSSCSSPTRSPTKADNPWDKDPPTPTSARPSNKAVLDMSGRKKANPPAGPSSLMASFMSRIRILDLSENLLGVNGAKVMAGLLDPAVTPHQFLTELRLNKCGIPDAGGIAIFRALAHGNNTLHILGLSNNECGNATAAALGEMLAVNMGLHELDMSWNQVKPEGVLDLCKGLDANTTLQRLDLSWSGLENQGVVRLGQMLMVNTGLKHLNLTNTRMGGEACIMLGEGIKANKRLEDLVLNGNAVGDDGARHLMSALKQNDTLQFLGLQGSNMSSAARGQTSASDFNPLAPDGSYSLLLSNPPDRAVAAQLCQLECDGKTEMMKNIKLDGRNVTSVKAMRWPEALPVAGMLTCDFVTRRSQKVLQVMDHKKFQALVGQLDSASMSDKEKSALVDVMAPFTYLYCHQIAQVLKCFSMGGELVRSAALLFTRAADLEERVEQMTSVMQERDIHALQQALGWYSYLRFTNPTGHYELNLTTHVHQALAGRLKDVAYGEPSDGNNWHNIIHDLYTHTSKVPSNYGPPEMWKGTVPQRGTLAFDFVSTGTLPDDAQAVPDDQLLDFLHHSIGVRFTDQGVPIPEQDFGEADMQVALLRQEVGHQFHFTCAQVIRIMGCFLYGPHKVEVGVMLYARLLDRRNWWTIMYTLRSVEQGLLMWRLGVQNVFDKSHPSGHYILDLANPAHEQVARRLVDLAANNSTDVPFFWNIRLQGTKRNMVENRNMWGTLTAETFTPFLECDFIGPDVPDCILNKSKADWEALTKGDRLDAVTRLSKRMELQRIKDMYGHFNDGSGWTPPMWATSSQLFKPLLNKAPWLAAWDRLMRLLVRYDMRSGDIGSDSYIEDIFDAHCSDEGELSNESYEALCKEWGYTRSEMHYHYRPLFEQAARPSIVVPTNPDGSPAVPSDQQGTAAPAPAGPVASPGPLGMRASAGTIPSAAELLTGRARTSLALPSTRSSGTGDGAAGGAPPVPLVLDFPAFVEVFMREPAPDVRFKEIPIITNLLTVAAAAKALKGLRKPGAKK